VAALAESICLLSFVRNIPDRHYPLTAIPPFSPNIVAEFLSLLILVWISDCLQFRLATNVSDAL
jgi:hypothetical protein